MLYQAANPHGGDLYGRAVTLDFSVNTNPLGTPPAAVKAVEEAARRLCQYPDPYCRELTAALAGHEGVPEAFILCGCGAAELIYAYCGAAKVDRALLTAPTFSEYAAALEAAGGAATYVPLPEAEGFAVTEAFLEVLEKTACQTVFLCSPNNPTGRLIAPELLEKICRTCRERGAALTKLDLTRLTVRRLDLEGASFDFAPWEGLTLPLAGAYQAENAALALTALEALGEKGWSIPEEAVRRGLAAVRWPGRFEVLERDPVFLLDGAHNAHGMRAAAESLRTLFPGRKLTFLLGILADKDAGEMLDLLAPLAERVLVLRPDSPRAMDPAALCVLLAERGVEARPCASVETGLEAALAAAGEDGVICALGSLYLCGEVRSAWFKTH